MKEYKMTWESQRELVGKGSGFLLVGFLVLPQISFCLLVPYLGFFLIGIALVFAESKEQRIVITQRCLEYHGVGFDIEVEWQHISDIDTDLLLGDEGVFIDKSFIVPKNSYFNLKPYKGFRKEFFIPLSRFQKNWRNSELGQQIKQYAPHLFQNKKSA